MGQVDYGGQVDCGEDCGGKDKDQKLSSFFQEAKTAMSR